MVNTNLTICFSDMTKRLPERAIHRNLLFRAEPLCDGAKVAKRETRMRAIAIARAAKRLNDLRTTLGPYAKKRRDSSFARHPVTRVARGGLR